MSSGLAEIEQAVHTLWARGRDGEGNVSSQIDSIATGLRDRFEVALPRAQDLFETSPQQQALLLVEAKVQAQRVLADQMHLEARAETNPERARAIGSDAERFGSAADNNVTLQARILAGRVPKDEALGLMADRTEEHGLRDLTVWPGIVPDNLLLKRAKAADLIAKEVSEARRASLAAGDEARPEVATLVSRRLATGLAETRDYPRVVEALAEPAAWTMDATSEDALAMLRITARWEHADHRLGEVAALVRQEFGFNDRSLPELPEEAQSPRAERLESDSAEPASLDDYRDAADVIGGEIARARRRAVGAARDDPELGPFIRDELEIELERDLKAAQEQAAAAEPLHSTAPASLASVRCITSGWTGVSWSDSPLALRSLAALDRQVNAEFGRRLGLGQEAGVGM